VVWGGTGTLSVRPHYVEGNAVKGRLGRRSEGGLQNAVQLSCTGYHTIDELNRVYAWSMAALASGRCPVARHNGEPWTDFDERHRATGDLVVRAGLLQVRGDWMWLIENFRFRHVANECFCWQCQATHTGELSYLDVSPTARWRATKMTHEAYVEGCAREMVPPSALFSCPGFRLEHICIDSMHCLDLGVFGDAIGGIMFVEISQKNWHRSYQEGIDWLNHELEGYYNANRHLSEIRLTLAMVKPPDGTHPTLRCKAASCRHLAEFALFLAQRHARFQLEFLDERLAASSAEYRLLAVRMAQSMVTFHDSCSEPFVAERCIQALEAFVVDFNALRLLFRRGLAAEYHSAQVFAARPKLHMSQHIRDTILLFGNPRDFWCYGDEDFVGLIKKIAMQTRHPRSIESILLSKFRLYSALHAIALEAH
jgi:hypothetical protein